MIYVYDYQLVFRHNFCLWWWWKLFGISTSSPEWICSSGRLAVREGHSSSRSSVELRIVDIGIRDRRKRA